MRTWSTAGLLLMLLTAAVALAQANRRGSNYYAAVVYGMIKASHTRYALAGLVLAVIFAVSYVQPAVPVVPMLGVAVLLAVFYFTSFLRGFHEDE